MSKYRYDCQNCGDSYIGRKDRFKFCSQSCYHESKLPPARKCPVCSKEIPFKNETFCSKKCSGFSKRTYSPKSRKGRERQRSSLAKICLECGNEFVHGTWRKRICSHYCLKIRKKRIDRIRWVANPPPKSRTKEASLRYSKNNRSKVNANSKKWRERNKGKCKILRDKWQVKNKEKRRYYKTVKHQIDLVLKEAARIRLQIISGLGASL